MLSNDNYTPWVAPINSGYIYPASTRALARLAQFQKSIGILRKPSENLVTPMAGLFHEAPFTTRTTGPSWAPLGRWRSQCRGHQRAQLLDSDLLVTGERALVLDHDTKRMLVQA